MEELRWNWNFDNVCKKYLFVLNSNYDNHRLKNSLPVPREWIKKLWVWRTDIGSREIGTTTSNTSIEKMKRLCPRLASGVCITFSRCLDAEIVMQIFNMSRTGHDKSWEFARPWSTRTTSILFDGIMIEVYSFIVSLPQLILYLVKMKCDENRNERYCTTTSPLLSCRICHS